MKNLTNAKSLPGIRIRKCSMGIQWEGSPNGIADICLFVRVVRYAKSRHYYIAFSRDGVEYSKLEQTTRPAAMAALWTFCAKR